MARDDVASTGSDFDPATLVGLTVEAARVIATGAGCLFRATPDGDPVAIGMNMSGVGHVDVTVEAGHVVRACCHWGEFAWVRSVDVNAIRRT